MPKEFEIDYQRLLTATALLSVVEDSNYTKDHSLRVGRLVREMCDVYEKHPEKYKNLTIKNRKIIIRAAYFHDVGKIKLPKNVLFKAGKLDDDEFEEMKKHPEYGYETLQELNLPEEAEIVLRHHERLDGTGYPNGETNLSSAVQILSAADVFDAMTVDRPYRKLISRKDVLLYMYSVTDTHFSIDSLKLLHATLLENHMIKTNENIY